MNFREIVEASGYIAKNRKEAVDPRWSTSLTVDVRTDTMRKQLGTFYPTSAPADGQVQVKEAKTMKNKQLQELPRARHPAPLPPRPGQERHRRLRAFRGGEPFEGGRGGGR